MVELAEYIVEYCIKGSWECTCGKCIDIDSDDNVQNSGRKYGTKTADVQLFKVTFRNLCDISKIEKDIIKENFIQLIKCHEGVNKDIDILDGREHGFIEIGKWIGDRNMALMLMGMGELLDMWEVITPNRVASEFSEETRKMLVDAGCILIKYKEPCNGENNRRRSTRK